MSDRAALYAVSVRPSRGKPVPLGDIDGKGTTLGDVLARLLDGFSESSPDGGRVVQAAVALRDVEDLLALVQHGIRGVAAEIVDPSGGLRLQQTPDDLQLVRCGCLFRLPAASTSGTLAVHISNGRGIKGLFEEGLTARFRTAFPGLALSFEPLAEPAALKTAVADDRIEKVRLLLQEHAGQRSVADLDKWVAIGEPARIELDVSPGATGARIERTLLERFLGGDGAAFAEIVSFAGLSFDGARVGVLMPDDTHRMFDLAHPGTGKPVTRALSGIALDGTGEPTDASLLAALRAVLEGSPEVPAGRPLP
jgi:hypothetical protein